MTDTCQFCGHDAIEHAENGCTVCMCMGRRIWRTSDLQDDRVAIERAAQSLSIVAAMPIGTAREYVREAIAQFQNRADR